MTEGQNHREEKRSGKERRKLPRSRSMYKWNFDPISKTAQCRSQNTFSEFVNIETPLAAGSRVLLLLPFFDLGPRIP